VIRAMEPPSTGQSHASGRAGDDSDGITHRPGAVPPSTVYSWPVIHAAWSEQR
jgi:hypothetical protein